MIKQMEIEQGAVERADKLPSFTDRDLVQALKKTKKQLIDLGRPHGNEVL